MKLPGTHYSPVNHILKRPEVWGVKYSESWPRWRRLKHNHHWRRFTSWGIKIEPRNIRFFKGFKDGWNEGPWLALTYTHRAGRDGKWTALYSAFLLKALYRLLPQTSTHSHTDGGSYYLRCQPAHWVQCLAAAFKAAMIFTQDNARSHTSKHSTAWTGSQGLKGDWILTWPPSSPDLHPFGNLWASCVNLWGDLEWGKTIHLLEQRLGGCGCCHSESWSWTDQETHGSCGKVGGLYELLDTFERPTKWFVNVFTVTLNVGDKQVSWETLSL